MISVIRYSYLMYSVKRMRSSKLQFVKGVPFVNRYMKEVPSLSKKMYEK